jgi:hypothetical protein
VNSEPGVRASTSLLTLAFFAPVATGCVSNEYVIPSSELARLASAPPATRGQHVHVVQEIGERRDDAIPAPESFATQEPAVESDGPDADVQLNINANVGGDGPDGAHVARSGPGGGQGWRGGSATNAGGTWRGTSPGTSGGTWRGTTPGSSGGHTSGGGHGTSIGGGGGGGGGGNIGDAAILLAVVVVVVATVAMVGLACSEGVRFDGFVDLSPEQPVHLKPLYDGPERVLPLGAITPADAAATVEAKVMDDEGFGIRRREHVLDRRGATMKLDFGTVAFEDSTSTTGRAGPVGHVQAGYYFTRSFGVLATAALGGAGDGLGAILTRHELGLELQALPFQFGPLHAGGYVNGGVALAATTAGGGTAESGAAAGAGALCELDLTGRLALTVRAGGDIARFDAGWSPAATLSGGLAVY